MGYDSVRASGLNQPSSGTCDDFLERGKSHSMALIRIIILVSLPLLEFNAAGPLEELEQLISEIGNSVASRKN